MYHQAVNVIIEAWHCKLTTDFIKVEEQCLLLCCLRHVNVIENNQDNKEY